MAHVWEERNQFAFNVVDHELDRYLLLQARSVGGHRSKKLLGVPGITTSHKKLHVKNWEGDASVLQVKLGNNLFVGL